MASKKTALAKIIGASVVASVSMSAAVADSSTSPFGATNLSSGYNQAALGEGKCGEGKCGGKKAKKEGKCGEGKCGGKKGKKEGKCGEGKCGASV